MFPPYFNIAKAQDMQNAMQAVLPFSLVSGSAFFYSGADYGEVAAGDLPQLNASAGDYVRTNDWTYALGVLTDAMYVEIYENGVPVIYGMIYVTTGKNTVYGANYVDVNGNFMQTSILNREGTWTQEANYSASIMTNTAKNVTFKAYLRKGESLEVGTQIGMYYGRVDVTVRLGAKEQAKDRIDAFFPIHYDAEIYSRRESNTVWFLF